MLRRFSSCIQWEIIQPWFYRKIEHDLLLYLNLYLFFLDRQVLHTVCSETIWTILFNLLHSDSARDGPRVLHALNKIHYSIAYCTLTKESSPPKKRFYFLLPLNIGNESEISKISKFNVWMLYLHPLTFPFPHWTPRCFPLWSFPCHLQKDARSLFPCNGHLTSIVL